MDHRFYLCGGETCPIIDAKKSAANGNVFRSPRSDQHMRNGSLLSSLPIEPHFMPDGHIVSGVLEVLNIGLHAPYSGLFSNRNAPRLV